MKDDMEKEAKRRALAGLFSSAAGSDEEGPSDDMGDTEEEMGEPEHGGGHGLTIVLGVPAGKKKGGCSCGG